MFGSISGGDRSSFRLICSIAVGTGFAATAATLRMRLKGKRENGARRTPNQLAIAKHSRKLLRQEN